MGFPATSSLTAAFWVNPVVQTAVRHKYSSSHLCNLKHKHIVLFFSSFFSQKQSSAHTRVTLLFTFSILEISSYQYIESVSISLNCCIDVIMELINQGLLKQQCQHPYKIIIFLPFHPRFSFLHPLIHSTFTVCPPVQVLHWAVPGECEGYVTLAHHRPTERGG